MSGSILGVQIDVLPHTGIVVRNTEYFYGGGIQALHPAQVVARYGMRPVETIVLGHTRRTDSELRAFFLTIRSRFSPDSYDLFLNNCNHFSSEVSLFLLGTPIPERISGVPARVLASPLGPMLGQLMSGMNDRMGLGRSTLGVAPAPAAPHPSAAAARPPASTVLQESAAPLLYVPEPDAAVNTAMLRRLVAAGTEAGAALSPAKLAALDEMAAAVSVAVSGSTSSCIPWMHVAGGVLATALTSWPLASSAVPSLAFLRLLVVRAIFFPLCVPALTVALALLNAPGGEMTGRPPANLLLVTALVNACGGSNEGRAWATTASVLPSLADGALFLLQSPRSEMRLLASALLHNAVLAMDSEGVAASGSVSTQLLCGLLDGVETEAEWEVMRRRLLGAGRLLCGAGREAERELAGALGYADALRSLAERADVAEAVRALALEVASLARP